MASPMVFQRYEVKYLLSRGQRDRLLGELAAYLAPDAYAHSSVRSVYYDTPSYRLIRASLEKPVYKEKLRLRSYGRAEKDSEVFLELKKKYKDVVYKRRISLPLRQAEACLSGQAPLPDCQIGREIDYALGYYQTLAPAVFLSYERDAYHDQEGTGLRLTFDESIRCRFHNLTLASDPWGTALLPPDRVLMEVKAGGGLPLWLVRWLSARQIYKTSFSKYGAAYRDMVCRAQKGDVQYA